MNLNVKLNDIPNSVPHFHKPDLKGPGETYVATMLDSMDRPLPPPKEFPLGRVVFSSESAKMVR